LTRPAVRAAIQWSILTALALAWSLRPRPLTASALYGPERDSLTPTAARGNGPAPRADGAPVSNTLRASAQPQPLITINWSVLRTLEYRSGALSDTLRKLNGKRVRVPGFIVPLEDFQEAAKEFLLVPYFGACVHEPPPPPNQMVYVKMRGGSHKISMWDPVWIEGTLEVSKYQSIYGAAGFRMTAERIVPYRRPDEKP